MLQHQREVLQGVLQGGQAEDRLSACPHKKQQRLLMLSSAQSRLQGDSAWHDRNAGSTLVLYHGQMAKQVMPLYGQLFGNCNAVSKSWTAALTTLQSLDDRGLYAPETAEAYGCAA